MHTPVFTETRFIIAKSWKQAKRPSTDEWIKKTWCIYSVEYYSVIKKIEVMSFAATQMQLMIISEVSQTGESTVWFHLHVESKMKHKWVCLWNRIRDTEKRLVVAKVRRMLGEGWNEMLGLTDASFCECVCIYIERETEREWINNKALLYSIGNYIIYQYHIIIHNGKESK